MAGCHSKLEDERFLNWIKASYAGNIAKEGLQDFVHNIIVRCHKKILECVLTDWQVKNSITCSECSIENILFCPSKEICANKAGNCSFHNSERKRYRVCPNQICDKIRDEIKKNHNFSCPSWRNTRAEELCINPWEIGKCYLPREGYRAVSAVTEMDFNGILNVLINHQAFNPFVDQNICIVVKELGKQLRHSPDLFVDHRNLTVYFDAIRSLLTSSKELKSDKKAVEAVEKIKKLQMEQLNVSTKDMATVLQKLLEEKTRCSLRHMEETSKTCIKNMKEAVIEIKASLPFTTRDSVDTSTGGRKRSTQQTDCTTPNKRTKLSQDKADSCFHSPAFKLLTEDEYQEMKEIFLQDIIAFNSKRNCTLPISPLMEKFGACITDFYVVPELFSVEMKKSKLGGSEIKYPIESLEEVFRIPNSNCKEIYLSADAGLGKTAFCKYLAMMWCYAHQGSERFIGKMSDTETHFMKNFDFLFVISLRESQTECDIDKMIFNLIIPQLSHSTLFSIEFLQQILHRETSLVFLDGLDEWTHPGKNDCKITPKCIPHRKARDKCTILTTLRPWKLSTLDLNKSDINHQIEMVGLSNAGKELLKRRVVSKLNTDDETFVKGGIIDSNIDSVSNEIDDLEKIPMLLMYLVCLRCERKPIAVNCSKCELFSNIIDLKLRRNEQRLEAFQMMGHLQKDQTSIINMLNCFDSLHYCRKYSNALIEFGKLAYYTLFNEKRERTIIFENSVAEEILSPEYFRIGLASGILTQTEVSGYLLSKKSTVAFTHKTFQEYFAALFIAILPKETDVLVKILSACTSIPRILEMSNVFIFLSGMSTSLSEKISQDLIKVVAEDEITQKYRRTESFWDYFTVEEPLKRFQDMQIACMKEHAENINSELKLCLQDFIIDRSCQKVKYVAALRNLASFNNREIRSLNIELEGISSLHEIRLSFNLNDVSGLEHVYVRGECLESDLCHLLSGSVKTLKSVAVLSRKWQMNHFEGTFRVWSEKTL